MSRESHLKTIAYFWEARMASDKKGVHSFFSPSATYEMIGAAAFGGRIPAGEVDAAAAADRLIDDFKFHRLEPLAHVVAGPRAAVINRLEVSFQGGTPVETEACDFWEFDDDGRVTSLKQLVDTDLVGRLIDEAS